MKYFVLSRYYDTGKVCAEILTESEAWGANLHNMINEPKEYENYDQYIDEFNSFKEAEQYVNLIFEN